MKKTLKKTLDKPTDAVKALNAGDVINEIGNLQLSLQSTLSGISAAITGKLEQLRGTDQAIAEMEARLKELYGVEREYLTLEKAYANREIDQEEYDRMVMERNREWMEQEAERAKKWQRQEEEHNYEFNQTKKKFSDEFTVEVEAQKRNERIRQEELNKSWTQREMELKNKENEFVDLRKQVSDFDGRLKAEVTKAESIVAANSKKQYEHQIQLLMKDMEAERNMSDSKIQSLQIQIGQMHEQIVELNKQLVAARQDAKEVTSQALQSASGRQVADALQRVVDAKDQTKK